MKRGCDLHIPPLTAVNMCNLEQWTLIRANGHRESRERLYTCHRATPGNTPCSSVRIYVLNDEIAPAAPVTIRSSSTLKRRGKKADLKDDPSSSSSHTTDNKLLELLKITKENFLEEHSDLSEAELQRLWDERTATLTSALGPRSERETLRLRKPSVTSNIDEVLHQPAYPDVPNVHIIKPTTSRPPKQPIKRKPFNDGLRLEWEFRVPSKSPQRNKGKRSPPLPPALPHISKAPGQVPLNEPSVQYQSALAGFRNEPSPLDLSTLGDGTSLPKSSENKNIIVQEPQSKFLISSPSEASTPAPEFSTADMKATVGPESPHIPVPMAPFVVHAEPHAYLPQHEKSNQPDPTAVTLPSRRLSGTSPLFSDPASFSPQFQNLSPQHSENSVVWEQTMKQALTRQQQEQQQEQQQASEPYFQATHATQIDANNDAGETRNTKLRGSPQDDGFMNMDIEGSERSMNQDLNTNSIYSHNTDSVNGTDDSSGKGSHIKRGRHEKSKSRANSLSTRVATAWIRWKCGCCLNADENAYMSDRGDHMRVHLFKKHQSTKVHTLSTERHLEMAFSSRPCLLYYKYSIGALTHEEQKEIGGKNCIHIMKIDQRLIL